MQTEFSHICAYSGEERIAAYKRAFAHPQCQQALQMVMPGGLEIDFSLDFDKHYLVPFVGMLAQRFTDGISVAHAENVQAGKATYLTNHRDIILDASFLSYLLLTELGVERPYMGIGNNLYGQPWIEDCVRASKCFTVIRGGGPKELIKNAQTLSAYIASLLQDDHSVWLAQREGRAKDSNDRTAPAILKMLTMGQAGSFIENVKNLNICPVAISYEYDPCDYLKAWEMQAKRDNPDWKKTKEDDLRSMAIGISGKKGKVVYSFSPSINGELDAIAEATAVRSEQVNKVAELIDKHIHSHYFIHDTYKQAYELLQGGHNAFEEYVAGQIAKIELENKDVDFLRERILEMYANPYINYLKAIE